MAYPLVSDALWSIIASLLPVAMPRLRGGKPCVPDRAALTGILFVLRTGIQWEMLPIEMGCGSGIGTLEPFRYVDTELGQEAAHHVHRLRPLLDQQVPGTMHRQDRLLIT